MLAAVDGLISSLREVGIPVSAGEHLDAARALDAVDLSERRQVKHALRATLVKTAEHEHTFDIVFDLFFALRPVPSALPSPEPVVGGGGGGGLNDLDDGGLRNLLVEALQAGNDHLVQVLVGLLVGRHVEFEPGRAVAGTYYLHRVMRRLDRDLVLNRLVDAGPQPGDQLGRHLHVERSRAAVERLQTEVEAEIRRRLVADRGPEAVALTLRVPLPEDVAFLTASAAQVASLRTAVQPLSVKLAGRLIRRRRRGRRGALDFRRTLRRSMSSGGVPIEPVFRRPRPTRPHLFVLADISGSVATFATFTLQLTYSLRQQFSSVRSFVFVDGMDEVTDVIAGSHDIAEAARTINAKGAGIWLDGRSDYGNALRSFWDSWGGELSSRSTVLILGDARTNYHAPRDDILRAIRGRAGHVYWLNPEPSAVWGDGDSVVERYAPHCDAVFECRNIRQLRTFVEALA